MQNDKAKINDFLRIRTLRDMLFEAIFSKIAIFSQQICFVGGKKTISICFLYRHYRVKESVIKTQ